MRRYHKFLFGLILSVMLISPLAKILIEHYDWSIMPLRGHVVYAEYPEFSYENWFDGSYQKQYDSYLEDHIGLRNILVRFDNQVNFSLFRRTSNKAIIVGKDDCMFELGYIDTYFGRDFIGQEAIDIKCDRIKAVQDELKKIGVDLLIVLAPGKANIYPEKIPDRYFEQAASISNHDAFRNRFREKGINHIDFNSLFRMIKDTSRYPLYHKCSIHWNTFGAFLALDSIVGYMENLKGIDMPEMSYGGMELRKIPYKAEYDIGDALNLFYRIHDQPMPYPSGYRYNIKGKVRPKLMTIADSYYWGIYNLKDSKYLWSELDFRFYDVKLISLFHPDKKLPEISIEELKKFDFVMIVYTDMNLHVIANEFFEKSYVLLLQGQKLEDTKQAIRDSEERLAFMKEKAESRGISLEEQIDRHARYLLMTELKNESNTNKE